MDSQIEQLQSIETGPSKEPDEKTSHDCKPEDLSHDHDNAAVAKESGNPLSIVNRLDSESIACLMEMGFSQMQSEKAVYVTGNSGVEAASAWLADHSEDADTMSPIVPEPDRPKLSKEEAMAKARELQNRLRDERLQREKKEAIERERQRIESSKLALEQQRKLEEEERKRHIGQLQKEKKAHQIEKERQRELLKLEWEERFGVPYDESATSGSSAMTVEQEAASMSKKSAKDQIIHWCSRLKKIYKDSDKEGVVRCLGTIKTYATNVLNNPSETKYLKIKKENSAFKTRIVAYEGAVELLQAAGFTDDGGEYYAISGIPDLFVLSQLVKYCDVIMRQLT
eukprot:GHVQ01019261.1.p1 GENE.GHVQ01019261.1~~GHVQ01019261.1.p1  ORF type:complete len:340 (-),score=50.74 GHVQ01019261.1:1060-2079(-)